MQKNYNLPFKEELNNEYRIRTFSKNLDENELKWHFDEEDRIVVCEQETDWKLQYDDELPINIEKNKQYFIPEGVYHRLIKGSGNLIVKVKKLNEKNLNN